MSEETLSEPRVPYAQAESLLGDVDFLTLGAQIIAFCEATLCHGPGDKFGEPFRFTDDFARFVLHAYRLDPETRRRVYRLCSYLRAKGAAKSEGAAALACAEAIGPARFDGFDANGEPVGVPVRSPFVRCLATEETQSGLVYQTAAVMLEYARDVHGLEADIGRTRTYLRGGGEIRPSTAASASKDGGRETFAIADEAHLYVTPELHSMYDVIRRNLTKRKAAQPWLLVTSTAFRPGERSVAEELHEHVTGAA